MWYPSAWGLPASASVSKHTSENEKVKPTYQHLAVFMLTCGLPHSVCGKSICRVRAKWVDFSPATPCKHSREVHMRSQSAQGLPETTPVSRNSWRVGKLKQHTDTWPYSRCVCQSPESVCRKSIRRVGAKMLHFSSQEVV